MQGLIHTADILFSIVFPSYTTLGSVPPSDNLFRINQILMFAEQVIYN